jgi:threonine dehydrogenase-like Zn-dependent dehydrogenase
MLTRTNPNLPETYPAAAIDRNAVRYVELPLRPPEAGEVIVRVRACALCTWEIRTYAGHTDAGRSLLGGHELSGEVVAVGPASIPMVQVGDHVAVDRMARCGGCRGCREGGQCASSHLECIDAEGSFGPQGLADYLVVPAYQVVVIDPGLDLAEAALTEPVSCVLRSIERAAIEFGDDVLVLGAGFMGVLHARMARLRGARVFLADPRAERRAAAAAEAVHVFDNNAPSFVPLISGMTDGGPNVVFITNGDPASVDLATRIAAPRGRVVVFAATRPERPLAVSAKDVHHRELQVLGTVAQNAAQFHRASLLLARRVIEVRSLISARFPLERLEAALQCALHEADYRVVIEMGSS